LLLFVKELQPFAPNFLHHDATEITGKRRTVFSVQTGTCQLLNKQFLPKILFNSAYHSAEEM